MNKETYLRQLEALLKGHLSGAEVADILRDYNEFFEDGRKQGKPDEEIAAKLGSPELIAEQFTEEADGQGHPDNAAGPATPRPAEAFEKTASLLGRGLRSAGAGLHRFGRWLWKLAGRVVHAAGRAALWIVFLFALGFSAFAAILFVVFGLLLLVVSAATLSLTSPAVSLCGVFGGLFALCLSALTGILVFRMARRGWRTAERAYFIKEEASTHA